jgi:hypothetical protein
MAKGCEYLVEEESMDGTEYTCEHPVYSKDTCDRCRLGPKRKEDKNGCNTSTNTIGIEEPETSIQ